MRAVLLIVIDCLRADHVSSYGYHRETTPTIDRLAERGVSWDAAHSASSWTKPSVMSLLTGLYPTQHGAFQGIKRSRNHATVVTDILRSSRPTLAECFNNAGWRCGAFINNAQLGSFTKLDRGFDQYVPTAGKADNLINLFANWLEKDLDTPAFGYLHFLEAHWPYKPRRRHIAMFGGDRDTNHFRDFSARDYGRLRRAVSHGETALPAEHLEQMIQMYDGAVRRLDGKIKIVLGLLKKLGLEDDTAIVVTADHGDEFLEHAHLGHGQSVYKELTNVPLIACFPGGPTGTRIAEPVSHTDLPQTLLNLAGTTETVAGHDLLDGRGEHGPVVSELRIRRRYEQCLRYGDWSLHRKYKFEVEAESINDRHSPRQWTADHPFELTQELYDLAEDPDEQTDLIRHPYGQTVLGELTERFDTWWTDLPTEDSADQAGEVELDPRVVEHLRSLGYLE